MQLEKIPPDLICLKIMNKENKEYATAKFSNVNNEWYHSCMYCYLLTNKFYGLFDKHNIRESHEFSLINMTHTMDREEIFEQNCIH